MKKLISVFLCFCMLGILLPRTSVYANSNTARSGDYSYTIVDGNAHLTEYHGNGGDVVVPGELDGYPVTKICRHTFSQNNSITSITLSEGIVSMELESIFSCESLVRLSYPSTYVEIANPMLLGSGGIIINCPKLATITVDEDNPYLTVEDNIMYSADKKTIMLFPPADPRTTLRIPEGVTRINDDSCRDNTNLQEVIMPDSVEYIGYWAFDGNSKLKEVNISNNCNFIGQFAFKGTSLTEFKLPASVTNFSADALMDTRKLKKIEVDPNNSIFHSIDGVLYNENALLVYPAAKADITFEVPEGVNHIIQNCFFGASNLRQITLPDTVVSIEDSAFYDCHNLQNIYIPASVVEIGDHPFLNIYTSLTIYGSRGSYAETYATQRGIPFIPVNSPDEMELPLYGWHQSANGDWYYYENDTVDFSKNGIVPNGDEYWYAVNGKADFTVTTVSPYEENWWYVKNGKVDFTANTIASNSFGWWYIENGMVDFTYDGIGSNEYGSWYIKDGQVDFSVNGLTPCGSDWYLFKGGLVQKETTVAQNAYGWWYVEDGKVDFTANTVASNSFGWWYIENGMVDFSYDGLGANQYGTWYIENGMVDFSVNTVASREGNWYLFKGGQLQFVTTVAQNAYGWWYIRDGLLDFTYTGVAANEYGYWYIENGCLNWNYTGTAEDAEGNLYQVTSGYATPL